MLYHLRCPLLALEEFASVACDLAIVRTSVDMLSHSRSAAARYRTTELNDDWTNQ